VHDKYMNESVSKLENWTYEGTTSTDRGFERYKTLLGFDENELKGKTVLDLGSGITGKFAREARGYGINVIALNPELANDQTLRALIRSPEHKLFGLIKKRNQPKSVAAIGYALPLDDNSLDAVMSVMGVPHYLPEDETILYSAVSEMLRVVKSRGKIYLNFTDSTNFNVSKFEALKRQGINITIDKIAENTRVVIIKE